MWYQNVDLFVLYSIPCISVSKRNHSFMALAFLDDANCIWRKVFQLRGVRLLAFIKGFGGEVVREGRR